MTTLNPEARRILANAEISVRDWIAYGGWREIVTDENGNRRFGSNTAGWHGDQCGCTDDRCIGYHHDENDDCDCLPFLIKERAASHEAYEIWHDYRAAVDVDDCGDLEIGEAVAAARAAAQARTESWMRRNYPDIETSSLDEVVKGKRGISGTYPLRPGQKVPEHAIPDRHGFRVLLWAEGVNPDGYVLSQFESGAA